MQPRSLCSKILHFPGGISLDCSFCLDVAWDFVCHVRERHGFIQAEKATSLNITSVKRCRATAHIRGRSKRNMLKKQHILKMLFLEAFFRIVNNKRIKILKQLFLMLTDCFVMGNHVAPSFLGDVEWPSNNPFRGRPLGQFSSILSRRR